MARIGGRGMRLGGRGTNGSPSTSSRCTQFYRRPPPTFASLRHCRSPQHCSRGTPAAIRAIGNPRAWWPILCENGRREKECRCRPAPSLMCGCCSRIGAMKNQTAGFLTFYWCTDNTKMKLLISLVGIKYTNAFYLARTKT